MTKAIIYGVGGSLPKLLDECKKENISVIAFTDTDRRLWGGTKNHVPIVPPDKIADYDYDKIVIGSYSYRIEIFDYLNTELKIHTDRIDDQLILRIAKNWYTQFNLPESYKNRANWLRQFSDIAKLNQITDGSIAEVGVFRGDFAKEMNACFPDRNIYLFDTFEGYGNQDTELSDEVDMTATSVEMVREILPHPEKAIFKVGYFPESARGGGDNR